MTGKSYRWVYCAEAVASIAMKIESMGYGVHGHDVKIKLCLCSTSPASIDVEALKRVLHDIVGSLTHKPLWEIVGKDEALIEDLLVLVRDLAIQKIAARYGETDICIIKGTTGSGTEVSLVNMGSS